MLAVLTRTFLITELVCIAVLVVAAVVWIKLGDGPDE